MALIGQNNRELENGLTSGGTTTTASNGLTQNVSNIKLGGTLSEYTFIDTSTFNLEISGTSTGFAPIINVTTNGNASAIKATANSYSPAISGLSTTPNSSGTGLGGTSYNGTGVACYGGSIALSSSTSDSGILYYGEHFNSPSLNTTIPIFRTLLGRGSSGQQVGIRQPGYGTHIETILSTNETTDANRICSKLSTSWEIIGVGTNTSRFTIQTLTNDIVTTKLNISGAGIFTLTQGLQNFVDDIAAATGNIPINALYRTGSIVKIRVS